jgi:hypothetical protein
MVLDVLITATNGMVRYKGAEKFVTKAIVLGDIEIKKYP